MDNLMHFCDGKIKTKIIFYSRILTAKPCIPNGISPEVSDFILKLLVKDPEKRLGGGGSGAEDVKRHPFFRVSFPLDMLVFF